MIILFTFSIFFFFYMPTQKGEGGGRIRNSNLLFMRRGPQLIELLIRNLHLVYCNHSKSVGQRVRKPHDICTNGGDSDLTLLKMMKNITQNK
jgi:hypothetical protein